MKTAYCKLHMNCGVIKFTDDLLTRIKELQALVRKSGEELSADHPWKESLSVSIVYGGAKWTPDGDGVLSRKPSADGPVVVYGWHNTPGERCADTDVMIIIGPDSAVVESSYEEGVENALGWCDERKDGKGDLYDHTIETIPDVFFSEDFLEAWCEALTRSRFLLHGEVGHVVEDMPPEHRKILDEQAKACMEKNKERYEEARELERKILRQSCDKAVEEAQSMLGFKRSDYGMHPNTTKVKLGLDYHGVIDHDPEYFAALSARLSMYGGEVHVLTGQRDTPALRKDLDGLGIRYTHVFSISSHHEAAGTKMWEDERGPWMDGDVWDKSKAEYCAKNGIHIHFDDSDKYGKHFGPQTKYVKYPDMTDQNGEEV